LMILMPMVLVLASCAQTVTVDTYCVRAKKITFHKDDTPKTKIQIVENELMRQRVCKVKQGPLRFYPLRPLSL